MTSNKVLEYAAATLKESAKVSRYLARTTTLFFGNLLFCCGPAEISGISSLLSRPIGTQEELDSLVKQEAKRLGLDGVQIDAYIDDKPDEYHEKVGDNRWRIHLSRKSWANHCTVRHEMYHIKISVGNGLDPSNANPLRYILNDEPRAILYQAFRLKL